jgi:hypothetical protein
MAEEAQAEELMEVLQETQVHLMFGVVKEATAVQAAEVMAVTVVMVIMSIFKVLVTLIMVMLEGQDE